MIALFIFLTIGSFQYKMAEGSENNVPSEQIKGADELMGEVPQEEKSELALMMQDIDESYKLVEEMSGYYKYKKKQWKKR